MRAILKEMADKILSAHPEMDMLARVIRRDKAEQTLRLLSVNDKAERKEFIKAVKGN